uniref:Uncharacterized protein n=1 Tax=Tetradesmus obliquus TaxID=3088 RepID=A0A383V654_TETOB|eukprot:jgi/Sobl393_1/3959/SZX60453.1
MSKHHLLHLTTKPRANCTFSRAGGRQGARRTDAAAAPDPRILSLAQRVTVQDFDIRDLQARIDMEIIAAGNYSDPQQPAALQLPANTQLVLQTANRVQTYASGDVPGAFAVTVPLAVERPLLFYPFDAYSIELVISLSLEQLVQCPDNSTVQTGPGAAAVQAGCNPALRNSSRALPLPLIVRAKNRVDTMRVPLRLSSFRELLSGPGAAAEPQPGPVSIYLQAHGRHTPFVCAYAVVLTLMCVGIGLYLTVMALDQAFVRPRALAPATINTFAACLFSIPRIRSSLTGNIPAGMLIDIFGFGWASILTGCGLLLMISLYVGQYSHQAKLFQSEKKTN